MDLDAISAALKDQPELPPVERWNPPLSGDIDILIDKQGQWYHEGEPIRRTALVKLFASILRRDPDGDYVLVTPVEKWRIRVQDLPLQVVDFDYVQAAGESPKLVVETNVGRYYTVGKEHPLEGSSGGLSGLKQGDKQSIEQVPSVQLDYGIAARFSRSAYYRLVDLCRVEGEQLMLTSGAEDFVVGYL